MEKMRFPESEELPEGVKEIEVKDTFGYCTELYPDVEYAEHSGKKLHLQIMTPLVYGQDLKWPLIVYVQGSSWHKQKLFQSLPTLVRMCERGYAVAIVEHRESELAPFPAQVIDTKAAIRFLRMNGAHYGIDASKVALWGDSSGAHTALMAGITGDAEYLPGKISADNNRSRLYHRLVRTDRSCGSVTVSVLRSIMIPQTVRQEY